jgi:hypothetical protein
MKRIIWAFNGYVLGLCTSLWVQRRLRRTADRFTPEEIRRQMTERTRDIADLARRTVIDLRDAATEGRAAMRASELELEAEFGSQGSHPRSSPSRPRNSPPTGTPRSHMR